MSTNPPLSKPPVVEAIIAAARPLPERVLILDDPGDLAAAVVAEGVGVVSIVAPEDEESVRSRLDKTEVEIRVGDPLGPYRVPLQMTLFDAIAEPVFGDEAWPLVLTDPRTGPVPVERRAALRGWFEMAIGTVPRDLLLIERAAQLAGEEGRVVFACRPNLFARDYGIALSETVLAGRGPHLVVDARAADPARLIIAERGETEGTEDLALRPRAGARRDLHWEILIEGLRDPDHPLVRRRVIPAGLSDPADALTTEVASELLRAMEEGASGRAADLFATSPGRTSASGHRDIWSRHPFGDRRPIVRAEDVRDWRILDPPSLLWPYREPGRSLDELPDELRWGLESKRAWLASRHVFGETLQRRGLRWYEHAEHYPARIDAHPRLVCAARSPHNQAALLPEGALVASSALAIVPRDQDAAFLLLGLLNSSLFCFWAKHATPPGGPVELSAQRLGELPLPSRHHDLVVAIARKIAALVGSRPRLAEIVDRAEAGELETDLDSALARQRESRGLAVWWQEELDWAVYAAFGLIRRTDSDTLPSAARPRDRPFLRAAAHPARASILEHDPLINAVERRNFKRPFLEMRPEADARSVEESVSSAARRHLVSLVTMFRPLGEVRDAFRDDPRVADLALVVGRSPDALFEEALAHEADELSPARTYSVEGWEKWRRERAADRAAQRRTAGDHGATIEVAEWESQDFVDRAVFRRRGRHDVEPGRLRLFSEMDAFEGRPWVAPRPRTLGEARSLVVSVAELVDRRALNPPLERSPAWWAVELVGLRLSAEVEVVAGSESFDALETRLSESTSHWSVVVEWMAAGMPITEVDTPQQLDLDRLSRIGRLLEGESSVELSEAIEELLREGWRASEVEFALETWSETSGWGSSGEGLERTWRRP